MAHTCEQDCIRMADALARPVPQGPGSHDGCRGWLGDQACSPLRLLQHPHQHLQAATL